MCCERVLLDRTLKNPAASHPLDSSVPTIVFASRKKSPKKNIEYVVIDFEKDVLKQILRELFDRKIQSLIVEGGAKLLNSFLEQDLWDEARVFTSRKTLKGKMKGRVEAPELISKSIGKKIIGTDALEFYQN